VHKLVTLTGFYGGLRTCELTALTWEDIVFAEEGVLVKIKTSKTDCAGVGALKLLPKQDEKELCALNYFSIYKNLVPKTTGRLFCQFQNGKFINAPFGKNTIANIPQIVATFLGLKNPKLYMGHALRVSSATVLADQGANTLTLKRHGRWKSEAVAEEYVRESKSVRTETASLLAGSSLTVSKIMKTKESQNSDNAYGFKNCVFSGTVVFNAPNVNKE
jgi:integrase